MEDPARAQLHDDEYVQCAERGCDHNEEVAGRDHLGMIADEGQPTLLWIGRAHRSGGAQVLSCRPRRHECRASVSVRSRFVPHPMSRSRLPSLG